MKAATLSLCVFVLIVIGLVGAFAIFNHLTESTLEPCRSDREAGQYWSDTGGAPKNAEGKYLCPVKRRDK
jgi:hypothetical protein